MMKKLSIALLFLFFSLHLLAQTGPHTIELTTPGQFDQLGFEVAEVLDKRIVKSNIGFVQKGMGNKRFAAVLPDSFEVYMTKMLRKIILSEGEPLTLIFHEFNVSEHTKAASELGTFRIQMEFAKNIEGQLYSIGYSEYEVEGKGLDVTRKHSLRIMQGILACIRDFAESGWQDKPGELIDENVVFDFDYSRAPKRGLYATFAKMCKNEPISKDTFTIMRNEKSKYLKYWVVDKKKKKIKKRMMAFSNGEYIYLNASRYSYESHFTKSKFIGKYIYFEDRFSDPMAGMLFGLSGMAVTNIAHAIILDTETGLVIALDDRELTKLLKKYPEVMKTYVASKQKLKDKEAAIRAINDTFL